MRPASANDHPKSIKKIIIDRNLCIGATSCAAIASKAFKMDGEKAVLQDSWTEEEREILIAAAKSCPVDAIILLDENGHQLWPKKSE